jgi:DNA-binding MarR family transcriptional regulator
MQFVPTLSPIIFVTYLIKSSFCFTEAATDPKGRIFASVSSHLPAGPNLNLNLRPVFGVSQFMQQLLDTTLVRPSNLGRVMDKLVEEQTIRIISHPDGFAEVTLRLRETPQRLQQALPPFLQVVQLLNDWEKSGEYTPGGRKALRNHLREISTFPND